MESSPSKSVSFVVKLTPKRISIWAADTKLITGVAYYLYKNNLIMLDYERTWYGSDYAAGFTRPGSVGGTGYNGTSARVAATPNLNGNWGMDQRVQVVFQISY